MPELPALLAKSEQAIPKLMSQRVKIHTLHRDSDSLVGVEVVSNYSWDAALAKHRDLLGAEAKLKDPSQKRPHWADPFKAWGDVLVKQGHTKEALVKYDEALKYAPNWKQLKEARKALTKRKS